MTRSNTGICGICACTFASGACVHVTGQGTTDDPYLFAPYLDTSDDNLMECGPAGLAAFLDPVYLEPPVCNVYSSLEQTIPFEAAQILFFNETRYDTDSMHDPDNEPSRITFNTAGVYLVTLNVRWNKTDDSTATGDLAGFIRQNSSDILAIDAMPVGGGDSFGKHSMSYLGAFQAQDYVEALVKQDVVIDDEGVAGRVTVERMSPVFAASLMRPIDGMSILGFPS